MNLANMHTVLIGSIAFFLYLIAAILLGLRLKRRSTSASIKWQALGAGFVAVSLHGWLVFELLFTSIGLNLGLFSAISLITWMISLLLIFSSLTQPTENLTIFVFPSAAVGVALAAIFGNEQHIVNTFDTTIEIHILISIMAYSLLSLAAVQAMLLAVQDKHLRNKRPGGFIRTLPPLQTMETLLFQMIGVGFALQSLSLISGLIFIEDIFAQHLVHKTVLSIIAWGIFAVLLWGRWRFGWRGRTAIRWTLIGFVALLLSYVGSKVVLEIILGA